MSFYPIWDFRYLIQNSKDDFQKVTQSILREPLNQLLSYWEGSGKPEAFLKIYQEGISLGVENNRWNVSQLKLLKNYPEFCSSLVSGLYKAWNRLKFSLYINQTDRWQGLGQGLGQGPGQSEPDQTDTNQSDDNQIDLNQDKPKLDQVDDYLIDLHQEGVSLLIDFQLGDPIDFSNEDKKNILERLRYNFRIPLVLDGKEILAGIVVSKRARDIYQLIFQLEPVLNVKVED